MKRNFKTILASLLLIISLFIPHISHADGNTIYFVGDDTVVGMKSVVPEEEAYKGYKFIAENQKGLTWLESQMKELKAKVKEEDIVVFSIGFSEISNPYKVENYAKAINDFTNDERIKQKKVTVYVTNLLPINDNKYISLSNEKIVNWNSSLKGNIVEGVNFLDIYSEFEDNIETLDDGYHYTTETYKNVLDYILNKLGKPTITEIEKDKDQDTKKQEVGKNSWGTDSFGYKVYYDENSEILRNTFKDLNGATYFFDDDGHYYIGLKEINNNKYFFNELGMMKKNSITKVDEDHLMAFDEGGPALKTGWHKIGNDDYYVNKEGYLLTGRWKLGTNDHYFKEDGKAAKGLEVVGNDTYYFEDKGIIRVGWIDIGDDKYYFQDGGPMAVGLTEIENNIYFFDENGKLTRGFKEFPNGTRYFNKETGIMTLGTEIIDGKELYFDENGFLLQGWVTDNNNKKSYYDDNGQRLVGLKTLSGKSYFFDELGIMQTGFVKLNGKWKYFDEATGVLQTGLVENIKGSDYLFDENGDAIEGMIVLDGKVRKMDERGKIELSIPIFVIVLLVISPIVFIMIRKLIKTLKEMAEEEDDY